MIGESKTTSLTSSFKRKKGIKKIKGGVVRSGI